MTTKIGVFLNGQLLIEYPNDPECFEEAMDDLRYAIKETGQFHELKLFQE